MSTKISVGKISWIVDMFRVVASAIFTVWRGKNDEILCEIDFTENGERRIFVLKKCGRAFAFLRGRAADAELPDMFSIKTPFRYQEIEKYKQYFEGIIVN